MLALLCCATALVDWRTVNQRNAVPDMAQAKNLLISCYSNYCGSEANATMSCYWCKMIPDVIDGTSTFVSRFGDASESVVRLERTAVLICPHQTLARREW